MIYINVNIQIHYKGSAKLTQAASFPLRGRKPEEIALNWWKQIQKEMSYHAKLEKVIVNSEEDITSKVMELEKELSLKSYRASEDLPF